MKLQRSPYSVQQLPYIYKGGTIKGERKHKALINHRFQEILGVRKREGSLQSDSNCSIYSTNNSRISRQQSRRGNQKVDNLSKTPTSRNNRQIKANYSESPNLIQSPSVLSNNNNNNHNNNHNNNKKKLNEDQLSNYHDPEIELVGLNIVQEEYKNSPELR